MDQDTLRPARVIGLLALFGLGLGCFLVLRPFLSALLWAVILAYTTWPAYRVSQGEVRTMQHRLADCYRQQRFPVPDYASDALTALTLFLAKNAEGGVYAAPGLKR